MTKRRFVLNWGMDDKGNKVNQPSTNDKNIWLLWKLWVLATMRSVRTRGKGASASGAGDMLFNDKSLDLWKETLMWKMDDNFEEMARRKDNRDAYGNFSLRLAQDNMLKRLNQKEIESLANYVERFELVVREQKNAIQSLSAKAKK